MSESLVCSLGSCIDVVVGTDTRMLYGNMGAFITVRVTLDVSRPLWRCVALGGFDLAEGGFTLKEDPVANTFINELFESEYVDLNIDGSAADVPFATVDD
ncbi:hypothetical protein V6N13_110703 [Hibiscus sabdariffa]